QPVTSPPGSDITPGDVGREIRDFDRRQERRRRIVPRATMVGVLAGLVASAFRLLLEASDRARDALFRAAHKLPAPWGLLLGLAAAFNAPLAGVIFVLEELRRDFAPGALTGAFVASVTADVVVRLLTGQSPVFHVASPPVPPLASLPLFLVLGAVAGLLGVLF